jgi:hypothetical protein
VFVTPIEKGPDTIHFFWEERLNAWWPVTFGDADFDPLAIHVFDGDLPDDRVILLGGRDGYIRAMDHTAEDDDGIDIDSEVLIGPFVTKDMDPILLKDLQAIFDENRPRSSTRFTWETRRSKRWRAIR